MTKLDTLLMRTKTPTFCLKKHFIIVCPHFTELRQTLFDEIETNFIPFFKKLSIKRQFEILLYDPYNPELKQIIAKLMLFSQRFILNTKFSKYSWQWSSIVIWKSKIMIFSWKNRQIELFLENIPPKYCYCASFGIL